MCDFEFRGSTEEGILINPDPTSIHFILVTAYYENDVITKRAMLKWTNLIPKFFVPFMPIEIVDKDSFDIQLRGPSPFIPNATH